MTGSTAAVPILPAKPGLRNKPVPGWDRGETQLTPVASLPSAREVLTVAFRHRWSILLALLIPALAGLVVPFYITPKFEARTQVLVKAGREFMVQGDVPGSSQLPQTTMREMVDTVTQILQSMDLIRDVLRDETVDKLYPALAQHVHDRETREDAAAAALARDLVVAPVRLTNVIEIGLRNSDRQVATEALRTVLARFQERHVQAFSQRRSALLEEQIVENSRQLDEAQRARARYVAERQLFSLPEQRNLLVQQRARESQELREAQMRKASLEDQMRYLSEELQRQPATLTLQTTSQNSGVADDAQRRLRELREREREQLNVFGPDHPDVRSTRAAITATQQAIAVTNARSASVSMGINPLITTLRQQLAATQAEWAPLRGRIAALEAAVGEDDARLRQISVDEIALQALERRISGLETAIRELQQRQTEARFREELDRAQIAGLSVIQQPWALEGRVSPKRRLFLAGGIVIGGILAVGRLLLALSFGNRFLASETVERMLGVPVLLAVPHIPALHRRRQIPLVQAEDAAGRLTA